MKAPQRPCVFRAKWKAFLSSIDMSDGKIMNPQKRKKGKWSTYVLEIWKNNDRRTRRFHVGRSSSDKRLSETRSQIKNGRPAHAEEAALFDTGYLDDAISLHFRLVFIDSGFTKEESEQPERDLNAYMIKKHGSNRVYTRPCKGK
jgi:hypothetical protein